MTVQDLTRPTGDTHAAEEAFASILFSPEGNQDPYPFYQRLREARPVHHSTLGMWVLTRYDDVLATLRDKNIGKDVHAYMGGRFGGDWASHPALNRMSQMIFWANPPEHTRLTRLYSPSFTGKAVARQRALIQRILDDLLEPLAEAGGGDVVNEVCYPLPLYVMSQMLGMPLEEAPLLREPIRNFQRTMELGLTAQELRAADEGAQFAGQYFAELVARKRREPGDDLLSEMIAQSDHEGRPISVPDLVGMCSLMIGAGFESTTHMLGNGVLALATNTDQQCLLRERADELMSTAVDEILRLDAPVQVGVRALAEAKVIGGVEVPANAQITALIGAANHDPAHFTNPEQFRVDRRESAPLSYGAGVHTCIGWRLANLQAEVFFGTMLRRFSDIQLLDPPVFRPRLTLRGVEELSIAVVNS
jgi:cytochrome P450